MLSQYTDLLKQAYALFNAREIEPLLLLLDPEVQWPNGWKGGYVHGHGEVRDYWSKQWKEINPMVEPVSFNEKDGERVDVEVHQVVRDLEGRLLSESTVHHLYAFENGKVKSMEIAGAGG